MRNNEPTRTSRINKTKSPVVANNYKARASRASELDLNRIESPPAKADIDHKITKAIGLGRHRSQIVDEEREVRNSATHVVDEQVEPSDPFCGACCA